MEFRLFVESDWITVIWCTWGAEFYLLVINWESLDLVLDIESFEMDWFLAFGLFPLFRGWLLLVLMPFLGPILFFLEMLNYELPNCLIYFPILTIRLVDARFEWSKMQLYFSWLLKCVSNEKVWKINKFRFIWRN